MMMFTHMYLTNEGESLTNVCRNSFHWCQSSDWNVQFLAFNGIYTRKIFCLWVLLQVFKALINSSIKTSVAKRSCACLLAVSKFEDEADDIDDSRALQAALPSNAGWPSKSRWLHLIGYRLWLIDVSFARGAIEVLIMVITLTIAELVGL